MNYNLKKAIIVLIVALSVFGLYNLTQTKEPQYQTVELLPTTNHVYLTGSTEEQKYLDTLIRLGLQELKIDGVQVIVKPLVEGTGIMDGIDLDGYLVAYGAETYFLYLKSFSPRTSISKVSHELIHLKQYYDKKLIVSGQTLYWDGQVELLEQAMAVSYKSRAWEREASEKQTALADTLRKKLIKTDR